MGLLESIAKEQGIRMMDYKEGEKTLDLLREKFEISETCKGFAVAPNRKIEGLSPLVMYNEELTGTGLNAVIAHELGHIFMGHVGGNIRPADNERLELEANIFKAVLLVADLILQHMKEEKQA